MTKHSVRGGGGQWPARTNRQTPIIIGYKPWQHSQRGCPTNRNVNWLRSQNYGAKSVQLAAPGEEILSTCWSMALGKERHIDGHAIRSRRRRADSLSKSEDSVDDLRQALEVG